ncbi:MAG TPA: hypothetical protein VGP08_20980 [Pyrinomonadaceae bacterium]|jgi:hypothetical protein|nr:hypothetical protein [Pyrinomonadaceae bacterium]
MTPTKCVRLKAACISFVVLLALAVCASAQGLRKGENLTRDERDEWYKVLRWPAKYEDAWRREYEDTTYGGLSFYDLGRGKYLVEVGAYTAAHQSGYVYLLYDEEHKPEGPGRLLRLKGFETKDARGRRLPYSEVSAAFAKFHTKTRVLEIYSKYRASGDCGLYVRYRFVAARPVVIEARGRDCDDEDRPGLQDYARWPRKKL